MSEIGIKFPVIKLVVGKTVENEESKRLNTTLSLIVESHPGDIGRLLNFYKQHCDFTADILAKLPGGPTQGLLDLRFETVETGKETLEQAMDIAKKRSEKLKDKEKETPPATAPGSAGAPAGVPSGVVPPADIPAGAADVPAIVVEPPKVEQDSIFMCMFCDPPSITPMAEVKRNAETHDFICPNCGKETSLAMIEARKQQTDGKNEGNGHTPPEDLSATAPVKRKRRSKAEIAAAKAEQAAAQSATGTSATEGA